MDNAGSHAITIYALTDPRDDMIRYVGYTSRNISMRLKEHVSDKSPCHRTHWIQGLIRDGVRPTIMVL